MRGSADATEVDSGFFPGEPAERLGRHLLWLPTVLDPWEWIARLRARRLVREVLRSKPVWLERRYLDRPEKERIQAGTSLTEAARKAHANTKR